MKLPPDAPQIDLVITVGDNAAGEACPFWPEQPVKARWGYPAPSKGSGSEAKNTTLPGPWR